MATVKEKGWKMPIKEQNGRNDGSNKSNDKWRYEEKRKEPAAAAVNSTILAA